MFSWVRKRSDDELFSENTFVKAVYISGRYRSVTAPAMTSGFSTPASLSSRRISVNIPLRGRIFSLLGFQRPRILRTRYADALYSEAILGTSAEAANSAISAADASLLISSATTSKTMSDSEISAFRARAKCFADLKRKYRLDNTDMYGLTDVPSKRWDEFDMIDRDFSKNVYYALCFFFEFSWKQASDLMENSLQTFDPNSITDKLFKIYIDHKAYALATFVEDVNKIYDTARRDDPELIMDKFYRMDPENVSRRKIYYDVSLSDCIDDSRYIFQDIISENRKLRDRRRRENNVPIDLL